MIRTEQADGARIIRMEFGSGNAISSTTAAALVDELEKEKTPAVLSGAGRVFSAGFNLVELAPKGPEEMLDFVEEISVVMTRVLTARFPLVAAINGHAVAGGCVLAMACDHRVGTRGDFKIGMNELAIGLTLPAVITEILRGKLSAEQARRVILGGALYSPTDALAVGLVDDLADSDDEAIERATAIAIDLGKSPREFAAMKGSLVAPITERLQQTREALDRRFVDSWFGPEATALREATVARLTGSNS